MKNTIYYGAGHEEWPDYPIWANPKELNAAGRLLARELIEFINVRLKVRPNARPILLGVGSSGIVACAKMLELIGDEVPRLTMHVIKKANDNSSSHGSTSNYFAHRESIFVVVDDFVATGKTLKYVYGVIENSLSDSDYPYEVHAALLGVGRAERLHGFGYQTVICYHR